MWQELPGETCRLWSVILLQKLHAWLNVLWLLRSAPKRLMCWMVLCSVPLPWDPALPCSALRPRHCVHTPSSPTPGLGKAPADRVHGHSCRAGYGMSDLHGRGKHVSVCFHTCVQMLVPRLTLYEYPQPLVWRMVCCRHKCSFGSCPMLTWPGPGLRPAAWLPQPWH